MKAEKLAIKIIEVTEDKTNYSRQMRIIKATEVINQFKEQTLNDFAESIAIEYENYIIDNNLMSDMVEEYLKPNP